MNKQLQVFIILLIILVGCEKEEYINQLPSAPIPILPENGSVVGANDVEFSFYGSQDPEGDPMGKYKIWISTDSIHWKLISEHFVRDVRCPIALEEGKKYYWKVSISEYHSDTTEPHNLEGRKVESKVCYFYTNPSNVIDLKVTSSSNINWAGRSFVKLSWIEPEHTDYVEITFKPELPGIDQPIKVPAGTNQVTLNDFFNNGIDLKEEDAKVYEFVVKTYDCHGLCSIPDTVKAMPLDEHLVHDYDFNIYHVVKINNQVWLNTNLMTTHFNDGTPIPEYLYMKGLNKREYGYYYQYGVIVYFSEKNPCPCGFHIPKEEDWRILERFIGIPESEMENRGVFISRGDKEEVAKKLKSTFGWENSDDGKDGNGIDSYGFNAKPVGYYKVSSSGLKFVNFGKQARFWTNHIEDDVFVVQRELNNDKNGIYRYCCSEPGSIRCVRDY